MSSCSTSSVPQARTPQLVEEHQAAAQPMAVDAAQAAPRQCCVGALHAGAMPAAGGEAPNGQDGEAPNGQHHLLRHVLSPEQCSHALRHFGTTDSKAAARQVNRMSQRELRDMFAKVYSVHTNSNNNTWLRRKLLEAVGASRRFYNAASRSGRPKGSRRAPAAAAAGHTSSGSSGGGAAKAPRAKRPTSPALPATPLPSPLAAHHHPHHHPHHAAAPGPALPAGSPRALCQRMRAARGYTAGSTSALACHAQDGRASPAAPPRPAPRAPAYPRYQPRQQSSEEDTCSERSGIEAGHMRALAPHATCLDAATPTYPCAFPACAPASAFAAPAMAPPPATAAVYSLGSHGSLMSSQFAAPAPAPPPPAPLGVLSPLPACSGSLPWDANVLPRLSSLTTLSALLAGYPSAACEQAAAPPPPPALGLVGAPSADLGMGFLSAMDASAAMLSPAGACLPASKRDAGGEEWLTWDDWQLPSLF